MPLIEPIALGLIPQPPPAGLYVTVGPQNLSSWALETITKTIAVPAHIVWVDAANAFNAYLVGVAARTVLKDPRKVLSAFKVARPFTAYQLETMISDKTLAVARASQALFVVVSDPLRMFLDTEGRDTQVNHCYDRFLLGLKKLSAEIPVLVLSSKMPIRYAPALLELSCRITRLNFVDHRSVLVPLTREQALSVD